MYVQRYMRHLPAAGEIVIFDRSWYNRAGVERVLEFCSMDAVQRFLEVTPEVEKAFAESGIILIKYWLEVSPKEQTGRLEARIEDSRKIWKLSPMDLKSYSRWYDYSRARDDMFKATDTPWHVVRSDDKKRARVNTTAHLLSLIPYEELPRDKPQLPKRRRRTVTRNRTTRTSIDAARAPSTPSRQISIGHFQPRISPSAVAIPQQKQWSSPAFRHPNRQYRI